MRRTMFVTLIALIALVMTTPAQAQSRKEKKEARQAESAAPRQIAGGTSFELAMPMDKAFDAVTRYLQTHDVTLEDSKKEVGQIITALDIVDVGGFRNNNRGYRTYVTLIKNEATTTVKLKVTEQQRTKHAQAEPWSDPKINDQKTDELKTQLQNTLTATATSASRQ